MPARTRWHAVLVYFGLRDDPGSELDAEPGGVWLFVGLLLGVIIGLAVAYGVLALAGVDGAWRMFFEAVVLVGVVLSFAQAAERFRARRRS
jgi:hypothetical protein